MLVNDIERAITGYYVCICGVKGLNEQILFVFNTFLTADNNSTTY